MSDFLKDVLKPQKPSLSEVQRVMMDHTVRKAKIMMTPYSERVIKRYDDPDKQFFVSTTRCVDYDEVKFETAVYSQIYYSNPVVVELYDTKEEAILGHDKWESIMKTNPPDKLIDVSQIPITLLIDRIVASEEDTADKDWRVRKSTNDFPMDDILLEIEE